MAEQKARAKSLKNKLIKLIATFFYVGKFPFAPGTLASLIGLLLLVCVARVSFFAFFLFIILVALGFYCSGKAEKLIGRKDPGEIVIDEVCGVFLVFLAVPLNLGFLLTGFILFRFFDIVKPFPLKRLEKLPGSFGIMFDDLLAGVYANLILQILIRFQAFKV